MILQRQHFDLNGRAVLERFVFRPPLEVAGSMDGEACFILPQRGRLTAHNGRERFAVGGGQGLLMRCGNYLNRWRAAGTEARVETFIIRLYPDILRSVLDEVLPRRDRDGMPTSTGRKFGPAAGAGRMEEEQGEVAAGVTTSSSGGIAYSEDTLLAAYVDNLRLYFANPGLMDEQLTRLKIKELLLLLLRLDENGETQRLLHSLFQPLEYEPLAVVNHHYRSQLTLTELARLCNLSLSSFKRKFRALSGGESPGGYVQRLRLTKAAELLRTTSAGVGDIAHDCGYPDQGHFTRLFRRHYGQTPTEYRRARAGLAPVVVTE